LQNPFYEHHTSHLDDRSSVAKIAVQEISSSNSADAVTALKAEKGSIFDFKISACNKDFNQ
jgi:hypothetical protein